MSETRQRTGFDLYFVGVSGRAERVATFPTVRAALTFAGTVDRTILAHPFAAVTRAGSRYVIAAGDDAAPLVGRTLDTLGALALTLAARAEHYPHPVAPGPTHRAALAGRWQPPRRAPWRRGRRRAAGGG